MEQSEEAVSNMVRRVPPLMSAAQVVGVSLP